MKEHLSEEELDRDAHKNLILPLAGFSFAGLVGLIVLDATLRLSYKVAIFFLVVSFLSFLFSLYVQGYKTRRWHDQISTGVMDAGTLSLILSICYVIGSQQFGVIFSGVIILLFISLWLVEHIIRLSLPWRYLKLREEIVMAEKEKDKPVLGKRDLTYITCPIHNVQYPKGASCPQCSKK